VFSGGSQKHEDKAGKTVGFNYGRIFKIPYVGFDWFDKTRVVMNQLEELY